MSGDEVLASIDGALGDWSVSKDAARWVPEEKRAEVPAGSGLEALEALGRALAEAFRPAGEFLDGVARAFSAWTATPEFRALEELTRDPRVQAAIEEAKRRRDAGEPRACHCWCPRTHPAVVNVCDAHRPVTSRRYVTQALGAVDVPLCAPCALAQGVTTGAAHDG